MSCTFWLRRKKKAAELAKKQVDREVATPYKVEPIEEVKRPKKVKKDVK